MAKATNANRKANEVDDLLDGPEANAAGTTTPTDETSTPPTKEEVKEKSQEEIDLEAQIKALKDKLREVKGVPPKKDRVLKGVMVAFKNKAGDVITGLGVMYYVARYKNKLHYKEASQVVLLPEGWKEGDPIPELPEAPAKETK
jgi:hypothetical protein